MFQILERTTGKEIQAFVDVIQYKGEFNCSPVYGGYLSLEDLSLQLVQKDP